MVVDAGELVAAVEDACAVVALAELTPAAVVAELERWGTDYIARSLELLEREGAYYVLGDDRRLSVKREPAGMTTWPGELAEAYTNAVRGTAVDAFVAGGGAWDVPGDTDELDAATTLTSAAAEVVAVARSHRLDALRWTASARARLNLRPAA
jgi:hypothetical protein